MQMKEKLTPSTKLIAVVKANAYGHGAIEVAKRALDSGASALAVALLEEAAELRSAGIEAPILVLGRVAPQFAPAACKIGATLTVFQPEWLKEAKTELIRADCRQKLKVHLELDTGMSRTGIRSLSALEACLEELKDNPRIYLSGVYTHFATADEENSALYDAQIERFKKSAAWLEENWPHPVALHISNSAASIQHTEDAMDFIRYGVGMYGLYPSPYIKEQRQILLRPAFSLHSELIEVKQVRKGETVSYGATYTAEDDEWIGTVPVGYADGWIRKLQGASVLVGGKRMPIVGRICMDQFMIRLDEAYPVGESVTLIGKQGNEEITMDELAEKLETIVYEIPCMIGARIPRVYKGKR